MKNFLIAVGVTLLLLLIVSLFPVPQPVEVGAEGNKMPWQIEVDAAGQSRVFGLQPGVSTLAEARRHLGEDVEIAILATQGEAGNLEAYYAQIMLGKIQGRLILTLDVSGAILEGMRKRSPKSAFLESGALRVSLTSADRAQAETAVIRAISFIPAASLDDAMILQRFGEPAEKIRATETLTHYLYPAKGLDLVQDAKGKEILQYVAPRHFETRIRQPLLRQRENGETPQ
ncbi:MAG: hypothetical protein LBO00_04175 [Zoogloeaceae bacterium]|nr:hypothetical protein [Zoogloeaceae bacterium]